MKKILLLCVLLLLGSSVFAQERYVKPVDDAAKDASFLAFRKRLIAAVDKRTQSSSSILIKIELSYGGDSGVADFRKIGAERKIPLGRFSRVIKNGGAFYEVGGKLGGFAAPYTYSNFLICLTSIFRTFVFGNNVNS